MGLKRCLRVESSNLGSRISDSNLVPKARKVLTMGLHGCLKAKKL